MANDGNLKKLSDLTIDNKSTGKREDYLGLSLQVLEKLENENLLFIVF